MTLSFKEKKMSDAQIFQIFSLVYIAVGIGILINPGFYKKLFEDFIENAAVMYLGGITALVVGYLILVFHNTWTKDLSVIIRVVCPDNRWSIRLSPPFLSHLILNPSFFSSRCETTLENQEKVNRDGA